MNTSCQDCKKKCVWARDGLGHTEFGTGFAALGRCNSALRRSAELRTFRADYLECPCFWQALALSFAQEQAKDTVEQIEEFGLAVKAEPIEGERSNEQEGQRERNQALRGDTFRMHEAGRKSLREQHGSSKLRLVN